MKAPGAQAHVENMALRLSVSNFIIQNMLAEVKDSNTGEWWAVHPFFWCISTSFPTIAVLLTGDHWSLMVKPTIPWDNDHNLGIELG